MLHFSPRKLILPSCIICFLQLCVQAPVKTEAYVWRLTHAIAGLATLERRAKQVSTLNHSYLRDSIQKLNPHILIRSERLSLFTSYCTLHPSFGPIIKTITTVTVLYLTVKFMSSAFTSIRLSPD